MKQKYLNPIYTCLLIPLLLTGCRNDSTSEPNKNDDASSITTTNSIGSNSTALASVIAPDTFNFEQFKSYDVLIDMVAASGQLTGQFLAVKVYDKHGYTYFTALQQYPKNMTVSVSLANDVVTLFVDFYDEQSENVITQELTL